ncbi:MAG: LamG-like jellyroll fold domain-containing protein [Patescibacteria group bacterium]
MKKGFTHTPQRAQRHPIKGRRLGEASARLVWGFTVIELLVVIAVIGLLSSIVLVSLDLPGKRRQATLAKTLEFSQSIQSAIGDELVGSWTFENVAGGKAPDMSGYNNVGTIYGATQVDGLKLASGAGTGQALSFDGNDYLEIPYSASLGLPANNETVLFWVKHNGSSNMFFESSGWSRRLFGTVWVFTDAGNTYYQLGADGSNDGNWHLVGYTITGRTIKSYVDGKQISEVTTSADVCCTASTWWVGRVCSGSTCDLYYTGLIDEVRIYTKALTAGEIQKQYAEGAGRHQELAAANNVNEK